MYTVDDICERIAENLPAGFSSLEIIINLPPKIREDIRFYLIFKIGNRQFPASKTFIEEIIIPILKGSELVYQGTDKLKFCKSIS